jgi:hypothetical protein
VHVDQDPVAGLRLVDLDHPHRRRSVQGGDLCCAHAPI